MKFIDNPGSVLRMLSIQVAAMWAALFASIAADPMVILNAWNAVPAELRELLPPWVRWLVIVGTVLGSIILARVTKQPALAVEPEPVPTPAALRGMVNPGGDK